MRARCSSASAMAAPGAPVDAGGRETQGPAVMCQLIEEGVGGGVIGLATVAQDARHAGEQHEQVEITLGGQAVQVPAA